MSSTVPLVFRPELPWAAIAGARGPALAFAFYAVGLALVLVFPFGMWWLLIAVREPVQFLTLFWSMHPTGLMIAVPVFIGLATGILTLRYKRQTRSRLRRVLHAISLVSALPAVLIGSVVWIGSSDTSYVILILAQFALLFSLLWSFRVMLQILASAAQEPPKALTAMALGLVGATLGVLLASAVAAWRGGDIARMDATHAFYIWIVPALAGFGWVAPRPRSRSPVFAAAAVLLVLCVAWYAVPIHFMEPPRIECHHPDEPPRHNAYGFESAPWRWEAYKPFYWTAAPGSLAELTLRHIAQPLIGITCDGTGDVPPDLDAYNAFDL